MTAEQQNRISRQQCSLTENRITGPVSFIRKMLLPGEVVERMPAVWSRA